MMECPWVDGLTFADVLRTTVERFGDHDAMVFPQLGYRRNYAEFAADVEECARALLAVDVEYGEHVGIWATNWPQWVVTQFAAATVGAVLVNINPAYRAHELAYVLNQADIATLLVTDRFKSSDYLGILGDVCPELASCPTGELRAAACHRLRRVVSIKNEKKRGAWTWDEFRQEAERINDAELRSRQASVNRSYPPSPTIISQASTSRHCWSPAPQ